MAALEKIRKRAAILTIVIGAGLLAFILEEAVRASGAFRMDTMALQVGDEKIDIRNFQTLASQYQDKIQKQDPNSKKDGAEVQQEVVQQLTQEKLVEQECKDAGIDVNDDEILNLLFAETGLDKQTFDQIKNAQPKANPTPQDQQILEAKAYCESRLPEIANQIKLSKLGVALMGCLKPNKLEEALLNEEQIPYDIEYAKVDYAQYANKYKVSDSELIEAYNKYKEFFKIDQEQRRISFIKVDLDPSANDKNVANNNINKIYNDFASQDGILGIKNSKDTHLFIDSVVMTSKNQDPQFTDFLASGENTMTKIGPKPNQPRDHNTFIYKVTKARECPEKLGMNFVFVKGDKQKQDSVFNLISSGVTLDSIMRSNKDQDIQVALYDSIKGPMADGFVYTQTSRQQPPTLNGLVYQDTIRENIKSHLNGDFFLLDSKNEENLKYAMFAQVVDYGENITLYSVARARYQNDPSEKTISELTNNLQKYINKNKTAADFKKNAKASKYEVQECVVDASYPYIGSQATGPVYGTRDLIKWAFDNKPGAVSSIKTVDDQGYIVVVALEDVYKDYIPYTDPSVKQQLTTYLLNKKIGDALAKECSGIKSNDVAAFAQKFNTTTDTITYIPGAPQVINDGKVAGRIMGLGKNGVNKVQVIAGDNAFYIVKVKQVGTPRPQQKEVIANSFQRRMKLNPQGMLLGSRKVVNNTLKFSGQ